MNKTKFRKALRSSQCKPSQKLQQRTRFGRASEGLIRPYSFSDDNRYQTFQQPPTHREMSAQSTAQHEPTLNELVGLPEEIYFPFDSSMSQDSKALMQYDCTPVQRITMRDLETDDGRLKRQNGASIWVPLNRSKSTRPLKFCNEGTQLWGYYESGFTLKGLHMSSTSNASVGVIVPNNHEPCVDPWEVASNQEPPFYRKVFIE